MNKLPISPNSNLSKTNVMNRFTGSENITVSSAIKIGNIVVVTANVSNIKSGWNNIPLKFNADIVSTMLCTIHRNSSTDINLFATGSFNGSALNILSSADANNALQINFLVIEK